MDVKTAMERMGYKTPPHRLAAMAKTVAKVTSLLTEDGVCSYSVSEARLILEMAGDLINRGEAGV